MNAMGVAWRGVLVGVMAAGCTGGGWKTEVKKSEMTDKVSATITRDAEEEFTLPATPLFKESKYRPWIGIVVETGGSYQLQIRVRTKSRPNFNSMPIVERAALAFRIDEAPVQMVPGRVDDKPVVLFTADQAAPLLDQLRKGKELKLSYEDRTLGETVVHFKLDGLQGAIDKLCAGTPKLCKQT